MTIKLIQEYSCDFCGKRYGTPEEAWTCEKTHIWPKNIVAVLHKMPGSFYPAYDGILPKSIMVRIFGAETGREQFAIYNLGERITQDRKDELMERPEWKEVDRSITGKS